MSGGGVGVEALQEKTCQETVDRRKRQITTTTITGKSHVKILKGTGRALTCEAIPVQLQTGEDQFSSSW